MPLARWNYKGIFPKPRDDFSRPSSGFSVTTSDPQTRAFRYVPDERNLAVAVLRPSGSSQTSVTAISELEGRIFGDFALEVHARTTEPLTSGAYSVVFRRASPNNYYEFLVNAQGSWRFARFDGTGPSVALSDYKRNFSIRRSPLPNQLLVVAIGPQMRLYANGELLGEFQDDTYLRGSIGLKTSAWQSPVEVRFSHLQVSEP